MDACNDPLVEKVVIMASAQVGKALDVLTPIPTPDGWKPIGELVVGDWVFDEQGQPCQVILTTPHQVNRQCYRVTFTDHSEVVCDADHLWTVTDYKNGPYVQERTVCTSDIQKEYRLMWGGEGEVSV